MGELETPRLLVSRMKRQGAIERHENTVTEACAANDAEALLLCFKWPSA